MIVVTGASGQLGYAVINNLMTRMPPDQIVATVRDPEKLTGFRDRGIHIRQADFDNFESLTQAFKGASQVLIVSANVLGETAIRLHHNAIKAARQVGASRVLYTSHMGARKDSSFAPAMQHATTEDSLAEGNAFFTSLRHGFYIESALHIIGHGLKAGEIRVPEDGPVSWTSRNDLAQADAIILSDDGKLNGITPPLTASEAITMAEVAAIASEVAGRNIKHVTISDDEFCADKVKQGVPEPMAKMLLGMFLAARRGDFATVDPTLKALLGRQPESVREALTGYLKGVEV